MSESCSRKTNKKKVILGTHQGSAQKPKGTPSHAADWRHAGFNDIYFDSDSAKREGDIATIRIKDGAENEDSISFDCKRDVWLTPENGQEKAKGVPTSDHIRPIYDRACSRKWAFWK